MMYNDVRMAKRNKSRLDKPYTVRLSEGDVQRIEALAARLDDKPMTTARRLIRFALARVEVNPSILFDAGTKSAGADSDA